MLGLRLGLELKLVVGLRLRLRLFQFLSIPFRTIFVRLGTYNNYYYTYDHDHHYYYYYYYDDYYEYSYERHSECFMSRLRLGFWCVVVWWCLGGGLVAVWWWCVGGVLLVCMDTNITSTKRTK